MKVEVVRSFRDKHDKSVIYKKGDVIDVKKERYEEILKTGEFVKPVAKEKAAAKTKEDAEQK